MLHKYNQTEGYVAYVYLSLCLQKKFLLYYSISQISLKLFEVYNFINKTQQKLEIGMLVSSSEVMHKTPGITTISLNKTVTISINRCFVFKTADPKTTNIQKNVC